MATNLRPLIHASEEELVELARQRNEDAFAELLLRNTSVSFRLALSILKNRQEAEDEVQTSAMKAWKYFSAFHGDSRFSTWFRSIVVNQSLMRLRRLRRLTFTTLDDQDADSVPVRIPNGEANPEETFGAQELHSQLKTEIGKMPRTLREVLILRDIEQLTTEETALKMGLSEPAVKSRLARARSMLRERMERHTPRHSLVF